MKYRVEYLKSNCYKFCYNSLRYQDMEHYLARKCAEQLHGFSATHKHVSFLQAHNTDNNANIDVRSFTLKQDIQVRIKLGISDSKFKTLFSELT